MMDNTNCSLAKIGISCPHQGGINKYCTWGDSCSMKIVIAVPDDEPYPKRMYVRKERWYEKYYRK